jgi:hypothetical protein
MGAKNLWKNYANLICYKADIKENCLIILKGQNCCDMVKVDVDPGICGMTTTIVIDQSAPLTARVRLNSRCEHIDNMSRELDQVDAYQECFKTGDNSKILQISARHCQHFGCPVPIAIIKGIEVALGISMPKDVSIKISGEGNKQDQQ